MCNITPLSARRPKSLPIHSVRDGITTYAQLLTVDHDPYVTRYLGSSLGPFPPTGQTGEPIDIALVPLPNLPILG